MPPSFNIEVNVSQIEDGVAILDSKETGIIRWPVSKLPNGIKIGDKIPLSLESNHSTPPTESHDCEKSDQLQNLRQLLEDLVN